MYQDKLKNRRFDDSVIDAKVIEASLKESPL